MRTFVPFVCLMMLGAAAASAQPPAEPKIWTATASAGLALTQGNSDTSTINAAYDLTYDPKTRNIFKSEGLFLRGETEGELSANRLLFNVRDEYKLNARAFVFGQNQFLRDEFKSIDYLIAPNGGIGYRLIDTAITKLVADGGFGVVWEKNPGFDVDASAALTTGEKLSHILTATTTLTQSFTGLWKTEDFEDALFTFSAGAAVAISARTQLKVEFLDTFKNKPPTPDIQKNDVALLMAFAYKI